MLIGMRGRALAAAVKTLRLFISYSQSEIVLARRVDAMLKSMGTAVFLADHDVRAGQSLTGKILPAIDVCDVFILLWSKKSQESTWVRDEVARARVRGKYIVPIVLEKGVGLPPSLGDMKYVSATEDLESALSSVQEIIKLCIRKKSDAIDARKQTQLAVAAGCLLVLAALAGDSG